MNVTLAVVGKDFSEPDESIAASHIAQVQPLHAVVPNDRAKRCHFNIESSEHDKEVVFSTVRPLTLDLLCKRIQKLTGCKQISLSRYSAVA